MTTYYNENEITEAQLQNKLDSLMNDEEIDENWLTDLMTPLTDEENAKYDKIALQEYNETYRTTKKEIPTKKCTRCSGHGKIAQYTYKSGGVCFKCNGSGKQ